MSVPIEIDERVPGDTEPGEPKQDKPRGKCTGCAFDYQLGTARTGEHKGKLVIRKHNSRTGPGLCSGASVPPEPVYGENDGPHVRGCTQTARFGPSVCAGCPGPETVTHVDTGLSYPKTSAGHCVPGRCEGCCGCSSMCTTDPCGQPADAALPVPVVADPWTAPLKTSDQEDAEEPPYTATAQAADAADGVAVTGAWTPAMTQARDAILQASGVAGYADHVVSEIQSGRDPFTEQHKRDAAFVTPGIKALADVTAIRTQRESVAHPPMFQAPAPASDIPESTTTVSGQPEPDRDRWGRYLLLGQAHTRATTFAKLGANTKAIEAWNERNVVRGLTLRHDLLMLANGLEVKRDRNDLNSIAEQAKDAAGSKVAANIGTAYHAFTERIDAGLMTLPQVPQQYQGRVFQYIDALARVGLTTRPEWIERTTAVRADQVGAPLPVAGTLDRIFQLPDGSLVIGDLKTGSDLSYGEMEIEVQLALYAHGVNTHGLFDWNTKSWQTTDHQGYVLTVRTDIAIVVHLPADGDGCTLYVADIERGWRDAQRLGPLQASLKEKKRFRTLMASDLAPVSAPYPQNADGSPPSPVAAQPSPDQSHANDQWERAKHLFSTAETQARIAGLYQYAMDSGLFHTDQLAVLVGLGKDRLNALAKQR